jgi:cytosine/adenosine deaminase-related metal-dependent hydrolase
MARGAVFLIDEPAAYKKAVARAKMNRKSLISPKFFRCRFAVAQAVGWLGLAVGAYAQHADRIFVNGKIWTGDDAKPAAQALAVSGDKLLAVGSDQEIRALARADTAVVDLKGRRVVPGLQDSHLHFPGPSVNEVALDGTTTLEEFQRMLSNFAKAHPKLPWITGGGWACSAFRRGYASAYGESRAKPTGIKRRYY